MSEENQNQIDPSLSLLFGAAEGEESKYDPLPLDDIPDERGMSLQEAILPSDKKEEDPASIVKPADEAPLAAPKPEVAPEPDRPIRRSRRAAPKPEVAPVVEAAPVRTTEQIADDDFESTLLEDEADKLSLARYAEKKDPARYKGYGNKMLTYLKAHDSKLKELHDADPDAPLDDTNSEYVEWKKAHALDFSGAETRKLTRDMITDEVTNKVSSDQRNRDDSIRDEMFARDEAPRIKQRADGFYRETASASAPAELIEAFRDAGTDPEKIASVKKDFAMEIQVTDGYMQAAANDIEVFMSLTTTNPKTSRALTAYDPKNEQHSRILGFVHDTCDEYASAGQGIVKEGKTFKTRDQFYSMAPDLQKRHWTFSNAEIVKRAGVAVKSQIASSITAEKARLEGLGFKRPDRSAPVVKPVELKSGTPKAPRSASRAAEADIGDTQDAQVKKAIGLLLGEPSI